MRQFFAAVDAVHLGVLLMYREYRRLPDEGQKEFMRRERRIVELFSAIIEEGNASGAFRCEHPHAAAMNILMAAHTWSLKHWLLTRGLTTEAYTDQQVQLAFRAVNATPD